MPSVKLTKRAIDAIEPNGADFYVFDSELIGFGVRVRASGGMSYIVRYRAGAGRSAPVRRVTLAPVGKITPDQAREQAKKILGEVVGGADPAERRAAERREMTVAELADAFLAGHVAAKRRPKTAVDYKSLIENHIKPALGSTRIDKLSPGAVAKLHLRMKDRATTANRVLAVLSSMFGFAGRRRLVKEGFNPAKGIEKYPEASRERFLSVEELERFGAALHLAETEGVPWDVDDTNPKAKHAPKGNRRVVLCPHAAGAIRLLLFTGCRSREILDLEWDHVDFERGMLFLPTSKTGKRSVVLNAPALAVLAELPRVGRFVIAGASDGKPRSDLKRPWLAVTRCAGLEGLRIHDLRHNFASFGAGGGMGLPIVGRLLGHTTPATTARYAHLDNDPLRRASDAIGATLAAALEGKSSAKVVQLHDGRAKGLARKTARKGGQHGGV